MSRAAILQAVKANKPDVLPLPDIDDTLFLDNIDVVETFVNTLQKVGGKAVILNSVLDCDTEILKSYPNAKHIVATTTLTRLGTINITPTTPPHSLEVVDLAILEGHLGVAENAAVWLDENAMIVRALPFIAKDVVLILQKNNIVHNMHQAYVNLQQNKRSFGVFLSGPSKTADIEQCLVIGAQGAMTLTVFIV